MRSAGRCPSRESAVTGPRRSRVAASGPDSHDPAVPVMLLRAFTRAPLLLALAGAVACGSDASSAATPDSRGAAATTPSAGARRAGSINLAASDVGVVERGSIEEAVRVSGDLRPIETVSVRSRIEGDLDAVHVREGQSVRTGQPLATFDSDEQSSNRASALADRAAAETELSTAQWNLTQSAELFRAGAIAERDHRAAGQAVATARARLAAADARLRTSTLSVRDTRVLAPASGVIQRRHVEPGERVSRGAELFTLVRADVLELTAAVPARQANMVRVGQVVHFVADGRRFDGTVARVSPTIDPATRSATVYVQVPNSANALRGGTSATGQVVTQAIAGALIVPMAAVRQTTEGAPPFVYRIAGGKLERADVAVGVTDESRGVTEIRSGLKPGDRVVIGNVGTLGVGMQVTIAGQG